MIYDPQMTLRNARALYFRLNNFGDDGGYDDQWVKVKVWRIPIWWPNTQGRLRAVRLHDLHHVLTEYPTTWRGEAEIAAWEIGSGGVRKYYAGWLLDLLGVAQGLVINPRGVYGAFMRGSKTLNLYSTEFSDGLLSNCVGEFRRRLDLDKPFPPPTLGDHAAFVFWVLASVMTIIVPVFAVLTLMAVIGYSILSS